ncbi:condensation domain-containing protein [Serratia ureilytica]
MRRNRGSGSPTVALRRSGFAVAHYTRHGAIDRSALERAIRQGLAEADTVQAQFFEAQDGQPVQRLPLNADPARVQAPGGFDFSARPDAEQAALALMNDDLAQDLPADGERPLYRHAVIRVSADRWFWYQRFHHLTWTVSASKPSPVGSPIFIARCATGWRRRPRRLPRSARWWKSFSNGKPRPHGAAAWRQHLRDLPSPLSLSTESREVERAPGRSNRRWCCRNRCLTKRCAMARCGRCSRPISSRRRWRCTWRA